MKEIFIFVSQIILAICLLLITLAGSDQSTSITNLPLNGSYQYFKDNGDCFMKSDVWIHYGSRRQTIRTEIQRIPCDQISTKDLKDIKELKSYFYNN